MLKPTVPTALRDIGMRFHACRGSMSVGQKDGGLPPDSVVEKEADILKDSQRLIEKLLTRPAALNRGP